MLTVGIDTGGTFTDVFLSGDEDRVATVKVPTTPHDLTVCFADAIRAGADALELPLETFLREAAVIRFSSTIGTNTVLTHSGPRLGLLVSAGAEEDLYGAAEGGAIDQFVAPGAIAGIEEEVGPQGEVRLEPDREQVARAVRGLLELGARLLIVSLRGAAANPANEQAVKRIIDQSYPRHYLGALPVLLSTQIAATLDDARRTASAVVNGYMHQKLATSLYRAEDDLRRSGFRHPLLIVNTDGGVTRVAKTRALATYQSGPTAGIYASALLCQELGLGDAITADVGGTSTDIGVLVGGRPVVRDSVDAAGVPVLQPSVELLSFGIGGGSIAHVQDGHLQVGPESAGAAPGPACFGLGGTRPTPTDAWLVLGYLTSDYYLGGRKQLDSELARRALATIAQPLGLSVEEAALAICEGAERTAAAGIEELLARPGVRELIRQRDRSELALIAYGGGGGLLLPGAARRLGLRATAISRYSPVFSAFGVSTFDVRHRYETCVAVDGEGHGAVVAELADAAERDMRGEGFAASEVDLHLTVSDLDGRRLAEAPADDVGEMDLPRGVPLMFELRATCSVAKPALPHERPTPSPPAPRTRREVWLASGRQEIPVYDRDALAAGAQLPGPALIEASDTTYLLPEGSRCHIHPSGSAIIEGS
jgi:N-methylhydantoinase A/acetophenone carboxylase